MNSPSCVPVILTTPSQRDENEYRFITLSSIELGMAGPHNNHRGDDARDMKVPCLTKIHKVAIVLGNCDG